MTSEIDRTINEMQELAVDPALIAELQAQRSRLALDKFDGYRFVDHGDGRLTVISPKGQDYETKAVPAELEHGLGRREVCDCPDFKIRCEPKGLTCKHLEMRVLWMSGMRPATMRTPCLKCETGMLTSAVEYVNERGFLLMHTCDQCGERSVIL